MEEPLRLKYLRATILLARAGAHFREAHSGPQHQRVVPAMRTKETEFSKRKMVESINNHMPCYLVG